MCCAQLMDRLILVGECPLVCVKNSLSWMLRRRTTNEYKGPLNVKIKVTLKGYKQLDAAFKIKTSLVGRSHHFFCIFYFFLILIHTVSALLRLLLLPIFVEMKLIGA